ncbi:MAG: hypothetical protein OXP75_11960 [Rhodospirillales bacterium]|nr:hypothetical protein [Rhodospirillales bacterium]
MSGPGTVILTGICVAACAPSQSRTRNGSRAATGPVKVGTSAVQVPFRMVLSGTGELQVTWLGTEPGI